MGSIKAPNSVFCFNTLARKPSRASVTPARTKTQKAASSLPSKRKITSMGTRRILPMVRMFGIFIRCSLSFCSGKKTIDAGKNFRWLRGSKPTDIRITAKPSHLPLGITPGIPGQQEKGLVPVPMTLEKLEHVPVADGLHGLQARLIPQGQQFLHLPEQPFGNHLLHPQVDPLVKRLPLAKQADLQSLAQGRPDLLRAEMFAPA